MDDILEKTKKAVEKYHSKHGADRLKATRGVLTAVLECRKYVTENEGSDSEVAQRVARELSGTLAALPIFAKLASDKDALENIQDKKLADEQLDKIQKELENGVKELEETKRKKIRDWTRSHPVFSKLVKSASKRYPEGTYVLLFRRPNSAIRRDKKHKGNGKTRNPDKKAAPEMEEAGLAEFAENAIAVETVMLVESAAQVEVAENASLAAADILDAAESEESEPRDSSAEKNLEQLESAGDEPVVEPVTASGMETVITDTSQTGEVAEVSGVQAIAIEPVVSAKVQQASPELVIRPTPDGKVFTRFRPKEFSDEMRIYRLFRAGVPIVGACIISNGKLELAIGELPRPAEGGDQLRHLLSLSKDAVAKPGKAFLEAQPVLNELFRMSKNREIDKDSYILLFQAKGSQSVNLDSDERSKKHNLSNHEPAGNSADLEVQESPAAAEAEEMAPASEEAAGSVAFAREQSAEPETAMTEAEQEAPVDSRETADEISDSETELKPDEEAHGFEAHEEEDDDDESGESIELELISKQTEDGRTITRFRSFDFSDSRSIFEYFKKRPPVLGAAVIRDRELLKAIGELPLPAEGESQLDILQKHSREAVDKPAIDFIASNSVLNGIFELACKESRQSELNVVLFTEESGRLSILQLPDKRGRAQTKSPLSEFRAARTLHERFKDGLNLVGASVISGQAASPRPFEREREREHAKGGRDKDRKQDRDFRPRPQAHKPPVVVAAFGRTPLKQNVLLSPDILKRLGVDLSILY